MKTQTLFLLAAITAGTGIASAQTKPVLPAMSASGPFNFEFSQDGAAGLRDTSRPAGVRVSVLPGQVFQIEVIKSNVGYALEKVTSITGVKSSISDQLYQRPAKTYLVRGRKMEGLVELLCFAEGVVGKKDESGTLILDGPSPIPFDDFQAPEDTTEKPSLGVVVALGKGNGFIVSEVTKLRLPAELPREEDAITAQ